jgi:hypothetical protein
MLNKIFIIMNKLIKLSLLLLLVSCKKLETGNKFVLDVPKKDTVTDWRYAYVDNGKLTNTPTEVRNILYGTTWVLTKYVKDFATEYPNDTIHFINNNQYLINSETYIRKYSINGVNGTSNNNLNLYFFSPFGGSHYSGYVGYTILVDNEMNAIEFSDSENKNTNIKAWFIKIK